MYEKTALTTEDTEDTESGRMLEQLRQLSWFVDYHVRQSVVQGVRCEAVGYAARPRSSIAAGEDVDARVTHDQGFLRHGPNLSEDGLRALRIGLFGGKTVATVHPGKKLTQAQSLNDRPRRVHRLIGEHSHFAGLPVVRILQSRQGFDDPIVQV